MMKNMLPSEEEQYQVIMNINLGACVMKTKLMKRLLLEKRKSKLLRRY